MITTVSLVNIWPFSVFVNKVLLEQDYIREFMYCLPQKQYGLQNLKLFPCDPL